MKILIMHAYSSKNLGDGLLVEETINVLSEAIKEPIDFTIFASYPETFSEIDAKFLRSRPTTRGYTREFISQLAALRKFDLVVGVGGGYLRAGHLLESFKTFLVHGPQLLAAALTSTPTIYMPQSIGPTSGLGSIISKSALSRIDSVYVRDDRTFSELNLMNTSRMADLAILTGSRPAISSPCVYERPVLSIRSIRGQVPPAVTALAEALGEFDGYSQSNTAGNSDASAMASLGPVCMLDREMLMDQTSTVRPRVVVAVRLHAALMAIRAGHYVIHLAYERKGYGAFSDLGIDEYVHNVNRFEPERVARQARELRESPAKRADYDRRVTDGFTEADGEKQRLINEIIVSLGNSTQIPAIRGSRSVDGADASRLNDGQGAL